MSDVTAKPEPDIFLLPSEIKTNSRYNVRPFSAAATAHEDKLIEHMALSIEQDGQMDALLLDPGHVLIAGHRRRKAVIVVNERRSARGQSLLRLRCHVDHTGGDLRKKAIISNLQRKESSPMDLAYLIKRIREDHGWPNNWQGNKQIGAYLGIDPMKVHQHELLLDSKCDRALQNQIHEGLISMQSAMDLLKATANPKVQAQVVQRASEIQAEDKLEKTLESFKAGKKSLSETTSLLTTYLPTRIEHPAIVKAIRETHATTTIRRRIALTRAELIQSLARLDSEDCPEPAKAFVRYLVSEFAAGAGDVEELRRRFVALTAPLTRKPASSAAYAS